MRLQHWRIFGLDVACLTRAAFFSHWKWLLALYSFGAVILSLNWNFLQNIHFHVNIFYRIFSVYFEHLNRFLAMIGSIQQNKSLVRQINVCNVVAYSENNIIIQCSMGNVINKIVQESVYVVRLENDACSNHLCSERQYFNASRIPWSAALTPKTCLSTHRGRT